MRRTTSRMAGGDLYTALLPALLPVLDKSVLSCCALSTLF